MKCSESPIVSKRANPAEAVDSPRSAVEDERLHKLASEFEAQLLTVVMRPMTKSMGPMSELMAQQMAMNVAVQTSDPLYQELKDQIG